MSKFQPPTREDVRTYPLNAEIVRYLERYCERSGTSKGDVRTLDWGCGRGEAVARLLDAGYDAMGADISDSALQYGTQYFVNIDDPKAHERLHRIGGDGRLTTVGAGSFDYIYSQTVLEHVEDLDAVAHELFRLMKPGGLSFHAFPAQYHFIEDHMDIPMVHWLPKNRTRDWWIRFWMMWGREPRWVDEPYAERLQRYVRYINGHTFYRSLGEIRRSFEAAGFEVSFVSGDHPRIQNHAVLGPLARMPGLGRLFGDLVATFSVTQMQLDKPLEATAGEPTLERRASVTSSP